jgi:hypothetical protein
LSFVGLNGPPSSALPHGRFLSNVTSIKATHDSSTIDSVHTPQINPDTPSLPEVMRPPLLPDNDAPHPGIEAPDTEAIEPVIRAEISTVCADGTHIDTPSAISEVADNPAVELDPYDLTSKVTASGAQAKERAAEKLEKPKIFKALWNGLLDDLFGVKKPSKP